jgi:hypothetical protein
MPKEKILFEENISRINYEGFSKVVLDGVTLKDQTIKWTGKKGIMKISDEVSAHFRYRKYGNKYVVTIESARHGRCDQKEFIVDNYYDVSEHCLTHNEFSYEESPIKPKDRNRISVKVSEVYLDSVIETRGIIRFRKELSDYLYQWVEDWN